MGCCCSGCFALKPKTMGSGLGFRVGFGPQILWFRMFVELVFVA